MKVLLVIPQDEHLIHRESIIPLGIAYINGALRAAGIDVTAYNLNYVTGDIYPIMEKLILDDEIDILLCGGTSYNYWGMKAVFDVGKQIKPSLITIGGGVGYTSNPLIFAEMTAPDYAIIGEGEITTCELIRCLEKGENPLNVDGIMYAVGDGKYVFTKERALIDDANTIDFPSYEGLEVERFFDLLSNYEDSVHFDYEEVSNPRVMPILFGRSCPYGCKFCFHTIGRTYRARSLDNFFEELDQLVDNYNITGITIMDEFFGVNPEVIYEFCSRIERYHLKWFAELRVDVITSELLDRMKQAGCINVLLGLESMDDVILKEMNKRITSEQSEKALALLYEKKITISGNFIAVTPEETMDSFYKTFDWWNRHREYQIDFVHLQLCPGTEYYNGALEKGVIQDERLFIERGLPELNYSRLSYYEWDKVRRMIMFTRMDNVMYGKIIAKNRNTQRVQLELTCRHCSKTFSKSIPYSKEYEWRRHIIKCPHCEHKSTYRIYDDSNVEFETEVFKQLLMNHQYGVETKSWLKEKNYKKVVLYGKGYCLSYLKQELMLGGATVLAVSYENQDQLDIYGSTVFGKTVSVDDIHKFLDVDVVVICQTIEYAQTYKMLREKGYRGAIDSMVNLVLQHDYFIEGNVW